MRPKKKDKVVHHEVKPQFEQIQADHELFLQAFESKCVWICWQKSPQFWFQNGSIFLENKKNTLPIVLVFSNFSGKYHVSRWEHFCRTEINNVFTVWKLPFVIPIWSLQYLQNLKILIPSAHLK